MFQFFSARPLFAFYFIMILYVYSLKPMFLSKDNLCLDLMWRSLSFAVAVSLTLCNLLIHLPFSNMSTSPTV